MNPEKDKNRDVNNEEPNRPLMITFDFLLFLLIIIIILGSVVTFSIIRHGLCARKDIQQTNQNSTTDLWNAFGGNPALDLLNCHH